ncbi:sulfite exporter TauE/SafE family protein [Pseudomonas sp. 21LCFQ02]|uniref:sulfite exporter TauE/SafE family protein n=1 Tax=Pseudomonas sp. 21LCFQ02 TaxID=2957505 RepID=UPI00209A6900|nr:sulfite exporter TauE/SafE family protein [Pseudomonas sp. 21LCFQ02]
MDSLILIVILGAALAGFVQGLSGSNFGLVAMAVWAWALDPTLTGPLVVCGSLTGQLLAAGALRKQLDLPRLWPMVAGGVLGVPLGVLLLHQVDPVWFRLLVGIVLVLWCPLMLFSAHLPRLAGNSRRADAGVGLVGGIMGGLGGLSGPAPALWAVLNNWDRATQRSVIQGFNLAMQASTMLTYLLSGTVTAQALGLFPVVVLAVLVPTLLGVRLYRGMSDQLFRRLVLGLLTLSGGLLIGLSLPKLLVSGAA